jgi:UDPglucose--hexose-1-phosphate uridylyltransferase
MSELRQDKTTGAWVLISPGRRQRPSDALARECVTGQTHDFDPTCPFCPGNEGQLPGIVAEMPAREPPGWRVRVVPNKYPAVCPNTLEVPFLDLHHMIMRGYGYHEVVIESPQHNRDLVSMSDTEREAAVAMYHRRYTQLIGNAGIKSVTLFRNRLRGGGASLRHPHAQLIALGVIPARLQSMTKWACHCYDAIKRCVTCDEIAFERNDQRRIVEETQSFLTLVPFAATVPSEIWLVPVRHQASFAAMNEGECADLGVLLGRTLRRLMVVHGDLPYNLILDSAGCRDRDAVAFHWRLRITPNLASWGGFERGTDLPINPSLPEQDAALLRAATAPDRPGHIGRSDP